MTESFGMKHKQTSKEQKVDPATISLNEIRETWTGRADFVLSCAGYSVGMGNIWRFPYLCYKNGGGAFLIPYLVFMIFGAFPMFFLEYAISQYSGRSALTIWEICPILKGVGYGMMVVNAIVLLYFNVMIAYVIYYLFHSFSTELPWGSCNNSWNTEQCYIFGEEHNISMSLKNVSASSNLSSVDGQMRLTASEEFWRNNVLQITNGLENLGELRVELFSCLLLAWALTFICICWGIKVTGKIVYVTVLLPYILLTIFLVKFVTLPGAADGLSFYIVPKWDSLLSPKVWGEAGLQVFFSSGMGYGGLMTFASFNKFNNNIYRDAIIGASLDAGTSFFAGFVTFAILGFMAHDKGVRIEDVVTQGPGLVFEAYPTAITSLTMSQFWAVMFFVLMLSVGIDTQFGMVETITCSLADQFPRLLKNKKRKVLLVAAFCVIEFLLGIPCIMQGGMYIIQLLDWYCALFIIMVACILECSMVVWSYGLNRIYTDIELMIGYKPSCLWGIMWKYITPSFLVITLVFNMAEIQPVSYNTYQYPPWAIGIGWIVGMMSIIPIFIYVSISLWRREGTFLQRIKISLKPGSKWGPRFTKNETDYINCTATALSDEEKEHGTLLL